MSDHILIERPQSAPGVQVIRLNRPEKKNAITRAMYQTLTDAMRSADVDPAVRATLLLGSEGPGLTPRWMATADVRAVIPMAAGVDSLNVAAATAVACYVVARR